MPSRAAYADAQNLSQAQGVAGDLLHQAPALWRVCKIDAALQHAAAVAVRGHLHAVLDRRVVDELAVLRPQPLESRRQLRTADKASTK